MEVMSLTAPSSQRKFTSCFLSAPTKYEEEAKKKLLRTFFDSFRLGRESRQSEEDH
ncbi:hypothetical protein Bca52824_037723 [Brassica carinata]|uniref:Uncharacterized protein n=1 Tax=Brassica carinata TaxID=52824 RepID=A0A8X7RSQ9_BRACI|nr:hypothetical protein Bca52824_037723 [Brassica carinata]